MIRPVPPFSQLPAEDFEWLASRATGTTELSPIDSPVVDELIQRCCRRALGPAPPLDFPRPRPPARNMSGPGSGGADDFGVHLVLSAGGARGLAHAGVLKVLAEAGIPVRRVTAVSAGALFGALCCAGLPVDRITGFAMELGVLVRRSAGLWDHLQPPTVGTLRGALTRDLFDRLLDGARFHQLQTPLRVVAADMCHARALTIDSGSVADAVRASMGVPGIYAPWPHQGHYLADGGLVNGLPVDLARGDGGFVVAVDARGSEDEMIPAALPDVEDSVVPLLLARARAMHARSMSAATAAADVTIVPRVDDFELTSYADGAELIAAGEEAARAGLERLQAAMAAAAR